MTASATTMQILAQPRLARPCTGRSCASTAVQAPRHVVRAVSTEVEEEISAKDVTKLLDTLTQPEMTIAELHLEMGEFEIKVRRKVDAAHEPAAPAPAPAPPSTATVIAPERDMQPALRLAPMPYQR